MNHRAVACWFTQDWANGLIRVVPELAPVAALLKEAGRGIRFGPATTGLLRDRILQLG